MRLIVISGPSGSGKSTIGLRVAQALEVPFIEGDAHHPASNVAKMARGEPLTRDDRRPWLHAIASEANALPADIVVMSCSALYREVRDILRRQTERHCTFFRLNVPQAVLEQRLNLRAGHFFKAGLLESQLAHLDAGTDVIEINGNQPIESVCSKIVRRVRESSATQWPTSE
jgi:gluconokinase